MSEPTADAPLTIAVLGTGQIGSVFAFQLAHRGRQDVTVIARPGSARLGQLQRDDGIVDVNGKRARVRVLAALDEHTPYDLVIVTLLDHQTDPLLPTLKRSAAKCVQFMFNTFRPERFIEALGPERCAFGMPFVQGLLDNDGKLKSTIGAGGRKTLMSDQRWVEVFNDAGIPAALEPDMPLWLRCHVPMCVAFESVAVAGARRGGGASWREAIGLAHGVHASFDLISGLGYSLYPDAKKAFARRPTLLLAGMLWSLSRIRGFRDVLATGKLEAGFLVSDMIAAAPGSKTPVNVRRIRAMDPN